MNNRRSFIQKLAVGSAFLASLLLPKPASAKKKKMNGFLIHHVYFWLNEPDNKMARAQFEKAIDELLKVENIAHYHFGVPASTLQREVVDHSYTYSYLLFFSSQADQDRYQTHPLHLKFVEENKHLWGKVIVYDSIDIK